MYQKCNAKYLTGGRSVAMPLPVTQKDTQHPVFQKPVCWPFAACQHKLQHISQYESLAHAPREQGFGQACNETAENQEISMISRTSRLPSSSRMGQPFAISRASA